MYTVILDEICEQELNEIKQNFQRLDELKDAIKWFLSKEPRSCFSLDDGHYLWKTGRLIDGLFPQLNILFVINEPEKKVFINAIKAV